MILSGCNVLPSLHYWKALDYCMRYLYHKSHVLMVFPNKKVHETHIIVQHAKVDIEIKDINSIRECMDVKSYTDSDLVEDIATMRSIIIITN